MKFPIFVFIVLVVVYIGAFISATKNDKKFNSRYQQRDKAITYVNLQTDVRRGSVDGVGQRNSGRGGK